MLFAKVQIIYLSLKSKNLIILALIKLFYSTNDTTYGYTNFKVYTGKFDVFGPREAVSADPLNIN